MSKQFKQIAQVEISKGVIDNNQPLKGPLQLMSYLVIFVVTVVVLLGLLKFFKKE